MLSQEWRCSWSSADRRCSHYIWVTMNFIAYWGATYIRGSTVYCLAPCIWHIANKNTKIVITHNSVPLLYYHCYTLLEFLRYMPNFNQEVLFHLHIWYYQCRKMELHINIVIGNDSEEFLSTTTNFIPYFSQGFKVLKMIREQFV